MAIGAVIIIIITYSSGMWGVAITDYIQFVFLGLGVLVATAVCFASAGGWQGIVSAAPESYFEIDPVSSIISWRLGGRRSGRDMMPSWSIASVI